MKNYFVPTVSTDDWRKLLADPEKHWRTGYSAKCLAESWQASPEFPKSVGKAFNASDDPVINGLHFVVGFPEFKVPLPGGRAASQTDLMVIARTEGGICALAVEGKVDEPFGDLVSQWKMSDSPGKAARLAFLLENLNLKETDVDGIRYQLLHRTVSAVLTAKEFCGRSAVMLVHSFSSVHTGFEDYARFVSLFGIEAKINTVQSAGKVGDTSLYFGWISDSPE